MNANDKEIITQEIDRRLTKLRAHEHDEIILSGNQYDELNQALSKVIAVPLVGELQSLKEYIQHL